MSVGATYQVASAALAQVDGGRVEVGSLGEGAHKDGTGQGRRSLW